MAAVKHLLEEILNELSCEELEKFKRQLIGSFWVSSDVPLTFSQTTTSTDIVDVMVQSHGQQSVEVTKKILMDMNRTDLVERLSETSSGPKEKHSVDKHGRALFERVESMTSVIELLLETLAHLSEEALHEFNWLLRRDFRYRPNMFSRWSPLAVTDLQNTVFFMVQTFGQQSVGRIRDILKEMQRIDLVQSLSDSSSMTKRKHSVAEHLSALINKVATMAAVKEILLETLNCLNHKDFMKFIWLLQFTYFQKSLPEIQWEGLDLENRTEIVDLMMETCGHQSVEVTREVLMDMNRTDLVQRLSETRSVLKATESSAETEEDVPLTFSQRTTSTDIVDVMVQTHGQESVEVTKKILMDMTNRTDLVERLSETSSGPKEKHSVDKRGRALFESMSLTLHNSAFIQ